MRYAKLWTFQRPTESNIFERSIIGEVVCSPIDSPKYNRVSRRQIGYVQIICRTTFLKATILSFRHSRLGTEMYNVLKKFVILKFFFFSLWRHYLTFVFNKAQTWLTFHQFSVRISVICELLNNSTLYVVLKIT